MLQRSRSTKWLINVDFLSELKKLAKQKSSATGDDAAFAKSEQKNEKAKLSMQTTDDHNNAQLIVVK